MSGIMSMMRVMRSMPARSCIITDFKSEMIIVFKKIHLASFHLD